MSMGEPPATPFPRSYWVIPGKLLAGYYPGDKDPTEEDCKLRGLIDVGIRQVIDLMEEHETDHGGNPFEWYHSRLKMLAAGRGVKVGYARIPIRDESVPEPEVMKLILSTIDAAIAQEEPVYVHCWGGRGRTGTVVGCYLIEQGLATPDNVFEKIALLRANEPTAHVPSPDTGEQREFVRSWRRKESVTRRERMLGGLWGAIVGDALGVPVEFVSRRELDRAPVIGMRGFGTYRQPAGTWSDDSSLVLCTVESLLAGFDTHDLARRFGRWLYEAYWTPHGEVFDAGGTTQAAIGRFKKVSDPVQAGGADEGSNGNGSLMRILPIALYASPADDIPGFLSCVHAASSLTHAHPRSLIACGIYCLIASFLLEGDEMATAYRRATEAAVTFYGTSAYAAELQHFHGLTSGHLPRLARKDIESGGYVVHTLEASIWCLLDSPSFEEAVVKAVNLGGDTDTTGCVTGGLAGLRWGIAAIPKEWIEQLARRDDIEELLGRFLRKEEDHGF